MGTGWRDLRYALRVLIKKPGFTVVSVASLALGIGANTAIFTVINAVFLHPLAISDPARVVELFTKDNKTFQTGNFTLTPTSLPNYEDYRDQNRVFTGLAAYFPFGFTPGYFETLRLPFREGRDFNEFDDARSKPVAIVNETLARHLWPGQDALSKRFSVVQETALYEVVGVVAGSVIGVIGETPQPMICLPLQQEYSPAVALLVRARGDPASLLGPVRDSVQQLDRNLPLRGTRTVQEAIEAGLWAPRMGAVLLSIFGAVALALAMIGVYGVMSYSVSQRANEIGIRMALGAQRGDVLRLVMKQGMGMALSGTALGVLAALALGRVVSGLLFGVSGRDPTTLAVVTGILTVVAWLACYVPARRATRVDPLVALRHE